MWQVDPIDLTDQLCELLYDIIDSFSILACEYRDLTEDELERLERYFTLAGRAKRMVIENMQEISPFEEMEGDNNDD